MDFDCHRGMFNAIGHIALILDPQHNILEANRAALKAIGKSEEELKGKKCYEILHSTDHPPENCPMEKMRLSGHLESSEIVVEVLNGIYLVSCTPQFDEKGVFESVIHIATDITKSENAKKALKVSEESYRQLIETEPECVKLLTEDNILVDMNPAGLSMIEADSLEQVVGKSIVDLIDPAFKDDFVNLVRRVFEGESAILEFSITGLKGTKRWLETHAAPLRDEDGKINFLLSVTRDTTERKQAEETIQKQNKNLAALLGISQTLVQTLDIDTLMQIILRKTTDFIGVACGSAYLIDENAGKAILWAHQGLSAKFVEKVLCLPNDDPAVIAVLESKKPIVSQEPLLCNKYVNSSYKEHNDKNVVIFSLRSHEKVIGFVNLTIPVDCEIIEDDMNVLESVGNEVGIAVENIRLFEETKKAYDELKLLDDMKNEFLSNVSHELKTPLVSIKGYSELMCDESLGALNEKQKKAMEVVSRNSKRLSNLIDSLIYLTMEKAKKIEFRFDLIQIVDIIKQAVADVHPIIEKKGLTIITDMPDELPKVNGDTDRLTEVIINLIDNAVKFTPKGGEITITACEKPEIIHITVKDTGVGIPKDATSKLFERFYQVDASSTRRYGGTGLGLYIVKSIVEMHNGQIWVESEEGNGTTFHILLPKICP
ncbi:MAG: ATP-binding protein [Methanosarcinaceae archaeon]|nr:ATP-binding protein [Methanosarcinaceae archaeon]